MRRGDQVVILGARDPRPGTVLGSNDILLIVEHAPGEVSHLRRDPASTKPLQWRLGGMPVEVRAQAAHRDFARRLAALEVATRHLEGK
jgi:hypothetical protein